MYLFVCMVLLGLHSALVAAQSAVKISWVPITFRQDSGTRPFINVQMNGKSFLMMVHANASFYVQTTHGNAASIGLSDLGKDSNYGIVKEGQVSTLGRTSTTLKSLKAGESEATNVRLEVFEIPQNPPTDGMLGTGWLRDQRVIVDYDNYQVGVPRSSTDAESFDKDLLARGYLAHKITWDADKRSWYISGTLDGHPIRFAVSTVAGNVVDIDWVKSNGVALGPVIDQEGGPAGAVVDAYLLKHLLACTIDGQRVAPMQPASWDLFGYSSKPRETKPHDEGFLGAEFMLANQAVVDFGTGTLFLKPIKAAE